MDKDSLSAFIAYAIWGLFPIYFKMLADVPSLQVMTHRVVWSFLFFLSLLLIRHEFSAFYHAITFRRFLVSLCAGLLLATNWLTYVWGIAQGYVVECSLGYFINPLVSILLGVVFLKERLRPDQWFSIGLAVAGVIYLTVSYGNLPWISLVLALSFGIYGLVKKLSLLDSLPGLTLETGAIFLPALLYLLLQRSTGQGAFIHAGMRTSLLLALTGIVSAIPLILFTIGARNVPLTLMGILQYITPSLQFLIGVFLYKEPFISSQWVGFGIIWTALLLFTFGNIHARRGAAKRMSNSEISQ